MTFAGITSTLRFSTEINLILWRYRDEMVISCIGSGLLNTIALLQRAECLPQQYNNKVQVILSIVAAILCKKNNHTTSKSNQQTVLF